MRIHVLLISLASPSNKCLGIMRHKNIITHSIYNFENLICPSLLNFEGSKRSSSFDIFLSAGCSQQNQCWNL